MSSTAGSLIVFVCVFGCALIGFFLDRVLPESHLSSESKDALKLATGLLATLSALVLGLLVSTAKGAFDRINNELTNQAADVILLDRTLAQYGPETTEVRADLKRIYTSALALMSNGEEAKLQQLDNQNRVAALERMQGELRALTPKDDSQRELKSRATGIADDLFKSRWLIVVQMGGTIPRPLIVVLVCWLALVFASFGLLAPRNTTVLAALLACALAVSGSVFLILEMDRPLTGVIRVSTAPMENAASHLGE